MSDPNDLRLHDIHRPDFEAEFFRRLVADAAKMSAQGAKFVSGACPACGSDDHAKIWDYQGFDYHRCAECHLFFICPAPTDEMHLDWVGHSEALRYWRDEMPAEIRASRIRMYRDRASYVIDRMAAVGHQGHTVLEIGLETAN